MNRVFLLLLIAGFVLVSCAAPAPAPTVRLCPGTLIKGDMKVVGITKEYVAAVTILSREVDKSVVEFSVYTAELSGEPMTQTATIADGGDVSFAFEDYLTVRVFKCGDGFYYEITHFQEVFPREVPETCSGGWEEEATLQFPLFSTILLWEDNGEKLYLVADSTADISFWYDHGELSVLYVSRPAKNEHGTVVLESENWQFTVEVKNCEERIFWRHLTATPLP